MKILTILLMTAWISLREISLKVKIPVKKIKKINQNFQVTDVIIHLGIDDEYAIIIAEDCVFKKDDAWQHGYYIILHGEKVFLTNEEIKIWRVATEAEIKLARMYINLPDYD